MKKTKILSLVSLGAFLLTTSGCTDYDFDSKYEDPSKVTQVTISNLMVGVFQKVKDYDVYEYNRFFGFDSQFTGKYAQTFGYSLCCSPPESCAGKLSIRSSSPTSFNTALASSGFRQI